MRWPGHVAPGRKIHDPWHVVDVLATVLEAAGATYPTEFGGHAVQPTDGESFLSRLTGNDRAIREQPIFWEHKGNAAMRFGDFKLVRQHGRDWELYDMISDRTELNNLAGRNAPFEMEMLAHYEDWAQKVGVQDWDVVFPALQKAWGLDSPSG